MTKKQLINRLIGFLYQFPLLYVLQFGVHFLTGLGLWWCVPISVVLYVMYDVGENIVRGEDNG